LIESLCAVMELPQRFRLEERDAGSTTHSRWRAPAREDAALLEVAANLTLWEGSLAQDS